MSWKCHWCWRMRSVWRNNLLTSLEPLSERSSPYCTVAEHRFKWDVVFDHWSTHKNIPFSSKSFPSDKTAGVFSRTFIVKNISNSLTYTITSSCVCTSPLAVMTIVGLHDFVNVSISAEFKSFLLIMCIDALESTTNSRSSSFNDWCRQTPIFRRREECCSFMVI